MARQRETARQGQRGHSVEACFRFDTPAFIAGPDPRNAEVRLPSLLGVLRFWWRALAWLRTDPNESEEERLAGLRAWEAKLFGSAATGQGSFVARLVDVDVSPGNVHKGNCPAGYPAGDVRGGDDWEAKAGLTYLMGQGLGKRRIIRPGGRFRVRFRCRGDPTEGHGASLVEALELLGAVGGLGARSRRGFGSLNLRKLCIDGDTLQPVPETHDDYRKRLRELLAPACEGGERNNPPFTALSPNTRVALVAADGGTPMATLHDEMGFRFLYFRSAGQSAGARTRRIAGTTKSVDNHRFEPDHQWFAGIAGARDFTNDKVATKDLISAATPTGSGVPRVPERAVFGLPHNYFRKGGYIVEVEPAHERGGRRASPLFLHLRSFENAPPVAVWMFLPARFLPAEDEGQAGAALRVRRKFQVAKGRSEPKGSPAPEPFSPDYGPIHDFLRPQHVPGLTPLWGGKP